MILDFGFWILDFQEINYLILWGGHLVRPWLWAEKIFIPQEKFGVF
jgi:hypothetical protein